MASFHLQLTSLKLLTYNLPHLPPPPCPEEEEGGIGGGEEVSQLTINNGLLVWFSQVAMLWNRICTVWSQFSMENIENSELSLEL